MIAIRVERHGGPEVLRALDVPMPSPGPGEARVRLHAIGVNFIDVYHRTGLYPQPLPFTPGMEGAGVVESLGGGVRDLRPGERVVWAMQIGSYAEHACVAADKLVPIPATLDFARAAALWLQGLTAHYLACSTFPVAKGQVAVVHAAAGGVGRLLVQVCKRRGALVLGTVSNAGKAEVARAAGADWVAIHGRDSFAELARRVSDGRGADVVYDSIGKDTFAASLAALRTRGMLVSFGQSSGKVPPLDIAMLAAHGSLTLTRPSLAHYVRDRDELLGRARELFEWNLDVHIDRALPLIEASRAHELLEQRATIGKVLLLPDGR